MAQAGREAAAAPAAERALIELLALEREITELEYVRRSDALDRVSDAARRLGELSWSEDILTRAATELGACSEFDRVLFSETDGGVIAPLAIWEAGGRRGGREARDWARRPSPRWRPPGPA